MSASASHHVGEELVILSTDPLNAESPPAALEQAVTPTRSAYVRTNLGIPQLGAQHRIRISGAVAFPFTVDLDDLREMRQETVTVTMECAGNDRTRMDPLPEGERWRTGAMSTSRWSGVPLRDLLDRAELRADAREVVVTGADAGTPRDAAGHVVFARSLPVREGFPPDTLLALTMNDEPIPAEHGAPVRLVVPGWYGMASVKWVTSIGVITDEFRGYFQRQRYVYDVNGVIRPVTRVRVKSSIMSPSPGEPVRGGSLSAWGWAWSGDGPITAVEVWTSVGDSVRARLEPPASPYAWTRWQADLPLPSPGWYSLSSRATDASGATQPDRAEWNRLGYGNNAVRTVSFAVA